MFSMLPKIEEKFFENNRIGDEIASYQQVLVFHTFIIS